jgi:hypothetical protein
VDGGPGSGADLCAAVTAPCFALTPAGIVVGRRHIAISPAGRWFFTISSPGRAKSMWLFTYVRSLQPQGPKACGSSC